MILAIGTFQRHSNCKIILHLPPCSFPISLMVAPGKMSMLSVWQKVSLRLFISAKLSLRDIRNNHLPSWNKYQLRFLKILVFLRGEALQLSSRNPEFCGRIILNREREVQLVSHKYLHFVEELGNIKRVEQHDFMWGGGGTFSEIAEVLPLRPPAII